MKENVERCGATAIMVEDEWGTPVSLDKLADALEAHPETKVVAFVHAETSTGVQSDAAAIAKLARKHQCLTIMDTVTSLGGTPIYMDKWGIDAIYSGSQKCLSCTPGLSPVSFSEKAAQVIRERQSKVQSWFLDLNLVMGYWGEGAKRAYHHTAPINALYGLHEALVMLHEEGLEQSWARHQLHHEALKAGLEAMGMSFWVDEAHRLPQLNTVNIPTGIDDATVRGRLLNDYQLEIGAGLGVMAGKVWRIGLMGQSACKKNVLLCLAALDSVLSELGADIRSGVAVAAANKIYADTE
jgi:alanine-glyoxylate transaminase/serine-glyoxylate transaminase/serine-pyruvate transaminase